MSRLSRKFKVPDELANLYEFANSLDLRRFTHNRVQYLPSDELRSPQGLRVWMSERGLLKPDAKITSAMLKTAIQLRSSLRAFLECDPGERQKNKDIVQLLNTAIRLFPLVAEACDEGRMKLRPVRNDALSGLSNIVAELYDASANGSLNRLKTCASDECQRVFFDRSKPGSRRWCASTLCGNRMKTRAYRERHRSPDRGKAA